MSDAAEIARVIAKEYADQTNGKVDYYYKHTSEAIREMSSSVSEMSKCVQKSSEALAVYEERQRATFEKITRMEREINDTVKNQKITEDDLNGRIQQVRDEVRDNSFVRKIAVWLAAAVMSAIIGGGILLSNVVSKNYDKQEQVSGKSN